MAKWQNVPTQRFWKIKLSGKMLLLFYLSLSPKERVISAVFHIFTDRGRLKDHLRSCLSEKPCRWFQPHIFVQQQSKSHKQGANKNKVDPKKLQRKTHHTAKIWYKFLNVFQRCCFTFRLNPWKFDHYGLPCICKVAKIIKVWTDFSATEKKKLKKSTLKYLV